MGMPKPTVNRPAGTTAPKSSVDPNEVARKMQAEVEAQQKPQVELAPEYDPAQDNSSEETDKDQEQSPAPTTEQTPRERWLARIEEVKLTEEEAAQICSEQLDPGYSMREYTRMGGRLVVKFRTRDAAHRARLRFALDNLQNPTQTLINETVLYQCLVSSIVTLQLGGRLINFTHPKPGADARAVEEAYRKRMGEVDTLGERVLEICFALISDFDRLIGAAMSEGAVEGF